MLFDGDFYYTYDPEGNRTAKYQLDENDEPVHVTAYEWNHRNELVVVNLPGGGEVDYAYDAFGRMVSRSPEGISGEGVEKYVYDGANLALVLNSDGQVLERALFGPAVDMILAIESPLPLGEGQGEGVLAGPVIWPLADNQGTIRDVAEYANGVTGIADHLVFSAFGNIEWQSSAVDQPRFTYTGRPFDSAVELYNYRARWYDAVNGVFTSADPLGFGGGDANLSRYCGNSPANFVDPSGLTWTDEQIGNRYQPADTYTRIAPSPARTKMLSQVMRDGVLCSYSGPELPVTPNLWSLSPSDREMLDLAFRPDLYTPSEEACRYILRGAAGPLTRAQWQQARRFDMEKAAPGYRNGQCGVGMVTNGSSSGGGTPCEESSGFLDWLQGGLDVGGVFDPTPCCDLISGIISVGRGRWSDAGMSVFAMIPYIGDAGKLAKYGNRLRKAEKVASEGVDLAADMAKLEHDVGKVAEAATAIQQVAKHHPWPQYLQGPAKQALEDLPANLHNKYHGGLDKLLPRRYGSDYFRELPPAQQAANFEKLRIYTEAFDRSHGTHLWDAIMKTAATLP